MTILKTQTNATNHVAYGYIHVIGVLAGPLLAAMLYAIVPDTVVKSNGDILHLGSAGRITAALAGWMALWWVTAVTSLYITSLLPLIILPLTNQQSMADTAISYSHPIIFLAFGGFILGAALEKWHLHERFAYFVIHLVGNNLRHIVAGFMFTTAVLSMWISNTAAAIIMLPVALSIIQLHNISHHHNNFALCLLLGICYSSSIGGMGTLIGTGPNMFFAAYVEGELQRSISFYQWMTYAIPLIMILLPLVWLLLTRIIFYIPAISIEKKIIAKSKDEQPSWNQGACLTLIIFILTASLWVFLPLLKQWSFLQFLSNPLIAIIAVFILFLTPANNNGTSFLMDWDTAVKKVPWGILLLLGGGLCLARAINNFGVADLLAYKLVGLAEYPTIIILVSVVALMVFLTEVSSNIASVTALTPIFSAMAISMGMDPIKLIVPITLASSCAFMLPVATPPNAIIFGSGIVRSTEMARAGLILNLIAIFVISVWTYYFI